MLTKAEVLSYWSEQCEEHSTNKIGWITVGMDAGKKNARKQFFYILVICLDVMKLLKSKILLSSTKYAPVIGEAASTVWEFVVKYGT